MILDNISQVLGFCFIFFGKNNTKPRIIKSQKHVTIQLFKAS